MKTAKKALDLALRFANEAWSRVQQTMISTPTLDNGNPTFDDLARIKEYAYTRRDLAKVYGFEGIFYQATGDTGKALGSLNRAIGLIVTDCNVSAPKGDPTRRGFDNDEAAILSDLYFKRAAHFFEVERYEESQRDCEAALRFSSANHQVLLLRGQCHMFAGRLQEAVTDLRRYLRAEAQSASNGSEDEEHRRQVEGAIRQCERALRERGPQTS